MAKVLENRMYAGQRVDVLGTSYTVNAQGRISVMDTSHANRLQALAGFRPIGEVSDTDARNALPTDTASLVGEMKRRGVSANDLRRVADALAKDEGSYPGILPIVASGERHMGEQETPASQKAARPLRQEAVGPSRQTMAHVPRLPNAAPQKRSFAPMGEREPIWKRRTNHQAMGGRANLALPPIART